MKQSDEVQEIYQIEENSSTRRVQFIILIFVKKFFCFDLRKKRCSGASRIKFVSSFSFSNLHVLGIIIF